MTESGSSFKEKLAQWNLRDSNSGGKSPDIVRLGKKNDDFIRLSCKSSHSVSSHSKGEAQDRKSLKGKPQSISKIEKEDGGNHRLMSARQRLRKVKPKVAKTRTTTKLRAKSLKELDSKFLPPVVHKNAADVEIIREALNKNFIFNTVEEAALKQLIDAFEPIPTYSPGDTIIQQGDEGDFFYVISVGSVDFEVGGKRVGSAESGSSFGGLALLYAAPRAATVKATSQTKLHRVDQTTFRYIMQSQAKQSKANKMKLLEGIDFFKQMVRSDLEACCSVMVPRKFDAGDLIVKKGDTGDAFYVVESGELKVTDISVGNTKYDDVDLVTGDYFGERALVKSEPRAANVVGSKSGTVFSIDRNTFEKICGPFVRVILKSQDKNRLRGINVFKAAALDDNIIEDLTQYLKDVRFCHGTQIFAEGEQTNPSLYLVREGQIQIHYPNGDEKVIQEGEYFGEDQLLADVETTGGIFRSKYSATVSDEDCICGVLSLVNCREVFDTSKLILSNQKDENVPASNDEDDDDEDFGGTVGRRASSRSSVDVKLARGSMKRDSILGEGQFGKVWQVTYDGHAVNGNFALKIQSKAGENKTSMENAVKRECEMLMALDHSFIVDLYDFYEDEENHYMVMGLIPGGQDLWSVVYKENESGEWTSGIPEDHARFYALILADTLHYVHSQKICYRDMKPENVMIDGNDGYPILVDFGFAKRLKHRSDLTYTFCGTSQYLAPEIIANSGHNYAVDHWGLGIIISEMVSGENPFYYDGIEQMTLFNDISNEAPYPLPEHASSQVKDIVARLLEKDPAHRLGSLAKGSKEVKMHPWFQEINLDQTRQRKYPAPIN